MVSKVKYLIHLCAVALLFVGCKKSVEIDIVESRCKDFAISNAVYEFDNPNCPGDIKSNKLTVVFDYDGEEECLNSIHRTVVFYDENNNVISTTSQSPDSVAASEPTVYVGSGIASFDFDFEVINTNIYDDISYVTVNFYTQNENLNQSNKLAIVANMPCKSIPIPSTTQNKITVRNTDLQVSLWDAEAEDGDIVTIILNGSILKDNVLIFNSPRTYTFNITPNAQNFISFYAVNEGTSSPNTVAGSIYDGFSTQQFTVNMNEGESISFELEFQSF